MAASTWKDEYYVTIYELVRQGMTMAQIAGVLGVSDFCLKNWYKKKPALKEAVNRARSSSPSSIRDRSGETGTGEKFFEYVYRRLPPELRELWNELCEAERADNPEIAVEALLENQGERTLQHLWIHALVAGNFNVSEACRRVNVTQKQVDQWKKEDTRFLELVEQVITMKKDYAEGCLFDLLRAGDAGATIFVNRTLNRDRGYDPKVTVVHEGSVLHQHVDVSALPLDLETKRKMLEAIRNSRELPPGETRVIELEAHQAEDDDDEYDD